MDKLSSAERELVALGAALGSNCVPCVERHVSEARKAGLSNPKIDEAIRLADAVRRTPARKALDAARRLVSAPDCAPDGRTFAAGSEEPCCG